MQVIIFKAYKEYKVCNQLTECIQDNKEHDISEQVFQN